ncbi:hypothetical protein AB0M97_28695 [Streptomyces sp. NPDC051207]|uniref:hypothetical protein n=1 Tax=Streptomyces sp. NPDC051207 TaxID=3154641 RepID=UPI0034135626
MAADQRRKKRRTVLLGSAAAVLAVVLAAGGRLLWPATDSAGKSEAQAARRAPDAVRETVEKLPASPEDRPILEHDEKDITKATETSPRYAPGAWATDKVFAKGVARRIEGYRIKPDATEKAWTLELDGHLCATSRHVTADGRTALVIQPPPAEGAAESKGVCDQVVFVDLNTGRKLWQKKMPSADFAYATNTNLTLTKGVVAWARGSVAYAMTDGTCGTARPPPSARTRASPEGAR